MYVQKRKRSRNSRNRFILRSFYGKGSEYLLIDFPFSNFCLLVLETDAAFELSSWRRGSTYKTSPFRCHPLVLSSVSPVNPLVTSSSDLPVSSVKRAASKRFSPFYSISLPLFFVPSSLFSFSPFSKTLSRRMSHLPFHIRLQLYIVLSPVVVNVSTGFSTDAQTLFEQIKSLSRRLKVFTRGDFEVQFSDVMKRVGRYWLNARVATNLALVINSKKLS